MSVWPGTGKLLRSHPRKCSHTDPRRRNFRDAGGCAVGAKWLGVGKGVFENLKGRKGAKGRGHVREQVV